MADEQALFVVVFDADARQPVLPRDTDTSEYTLFAGGAHGWHHVSAPDDTPPTCLVRVRTTDAVMTALKADPALLFVADAGSPAHDAPINAAGANQAAQWLRDHGYSGDAFGLALAAIASARSRRALAGGVAGLHGTSLDVLDGQHIGGDA